MENVQRKDLNPYELFQSPLGETPWSGGPGRAHQGTRGGVSIPTRGNTLVRNPEYATRPTRGNTLVRVPSWCLGLWVGLMVSIPTRGNTLFRAGGARALPRVASGVSIPTRGNTLFRDDVAFYDEAPAVVGFNPHSGKHPVPGYLLLEDDSYILLEVSIPTRGNTLVRAPRQRGGVPGRGRVSIPTRGNTLVRGCG